MDYVAIKAELDAVAISAGIQVSVSQFDLTAGNQ